ncbi:unnamed protein product, partial [marine sediment metagenome]
IGSLVARAMGGKWIFLLSVHLFYFAPKTIRAMLSSTRFKTIKMKPHIQTLSLGYLIYRMREYNKILYKLGNAVVGALRMKSLQIPYWLGQTLVIARKQ